MAGVAQADRAAHGGGEGDAEGAARPAAAVVAGFAAKLLELERAQPAGPEALVRARLDGRDARQVPPPLPETLELLPEHVPGESERRGVGRRVIAFPAAWLGITRDDKRRGRHPDRRRPEQPRPEIARRAEP